MKKSISAILLLLSLTAIAQKNAALILVDATQQKWIGGHPSSGSGERYVVFMKLNSTENIEVTKLWINKEEVFFELQNYRMLLNRAATKGDTIAAIYNPRYHNEKPELNPVEKSKTCKSKNQALVEYSINQKKYYLKVKKFRILEADKHM